MLLTDIAQLKKNDIITFKTIAGPEVVAYYESETETEIIVSYASTIMMMPAEGNTLGIQFIPFIAGIDQNAKIPVLKSALITRPIKVSSDMVKNYSQATSSLVL